ncbi:hypothetical protein JOC76_000277 [Neobacillus cucumis]|nr:hypothetical protein [Neobacillus cucumis]
MQAKPEEQREDHSAKSISCYSGYFFTKNQEEKSWTTKKQL